MSRSVLAGLTGSTLLHGALVAGLLLFVPRAEHVAPLFVDLTQEERPPGKEGGESGSAQPGRTVSAGRAGGGPAVPPATPAPVAAAPPMAPAAPVAAAPIPVPPAPSMPEPASVSAPPKVSEPDAAELTAAPAGSEVPAAKNGADSSSHTEPIIARGGGDTAGGTSGPLARPGSGPGDGLSSHSAGGSGLGLERPGSGLAVVGPGESGGDPGAAYAAYLGRLRQRVYEALRYPSTARRRGLTGTVVLELTVRPDGAIGRVVVVDSSSHATLDQAAVETVRSLRPQPFPADLPSRTLHVRLPVVFELQ